MSRADELTIGIDFGTCRSSASILIGKEIKQVNLGYDAYAQIFDIPTAIFIDEEDGRILVGDEAVALRAKDPERFRDRFKLDIGREQPMTVLVGASMRDYSWPELIAAVLRRIRSAAEQQYNNGQPIVHAVLTVPAIYVPGRAGAEWTAMQRAGVLAGFETVELIREPHAAAVYYDHVLRQSGAQPESDGQITLVYDLGGGTFDPALIRRQGDGYQILGAASGRDGVKCGGIFFDQRIREHFVRQCPEAVELLRRKVRRTENHHVHPEDAQLATKIAKDEIELGKFLQVVKHWFSNVDVTEFDQGDPVTNSPYRLTRAEFNSKISPMLDETIACCKNLVNQSGVEWKSVSRIIMVGGSCKIPLVRQKLEQMVTDVGALRIEICLNRIGNTNSLVDPLLAVSLGAALCAHQTTGNAAAEETNVCDVPSDGVLELGIAAATALKPLGEPDKPILDAIKNGHARVAAAHQPFRLGIVGDARAGKSTLINALAGEQLAFTDVIEATAVMCAFHEGMESSARIHYRDGTSERISVEEGNRRLSALRHDTEWISRVRYVEFTGTRGGLAGIEIWDAPGFGGSDHNDVTASEFLRRIGGAIWVFDCQFLGVASHIPPLESLKRAGKKVVAVVNKIDYLDEDQVPQAMVEANKRYGPYAAATAPLSAYEAYEKAIAGERDERLESLKEMVQRIILNTSEEDRLKRIGAAVEQAARAIAQEVGRTQRVLSDRLGFLEHIRKNFEVGRSRIMRLVPALIDAECLRAFSSQEQQVLARLGRSYLVGDSSEGMTDEDVKTIISSSYDGREASQDYKDAAEHIGSELGALWERECLDAIQLSTAAIPNVSISPLALAAARESTRAGEAVGAGVAGGVASGTLIGALVAAAPIAWPLLLAAIPIAVYTGWRTYVSAGQPQVLSVESQEKMIRKHFAERRAELKQALLKHFPSEIDKVLEVEIKRITAGWTARVLGKTTVEILRGITAEFASIHAQLLKKLPASALDDKLAVRPLRITADPAGTTLWRSLCAAVENRVDIVVPDMNTPLTPLLRELRSGVRVRVIAAAEKGRTPDAKAAFDSWRGKLELRIASLNNGSALQIDSTLMISDQGALQTTDSLSRVGESVIVLNNFPDGTLAAERSFAELWEGRSSRFGAITVRSVYTSSGFED